MKQVVVFPRGQLSRQDKERLSKAGVVAVEADEPSKVVMLLPSTGLITADDMLMSAFAGIEGAFDSANVKMVMELHRRAKARESMQAASPADKQ